MVNREKVYESTERESTPFQRQLYLHRQQFGIVPADQLRTSEDRAAQYARLESMVRTPTPLISIDASNGCTIWMKQESKRMPTKSHYDNATVVVLKELEALQVPQLSGRGLQSGDTVVEGTSGSAGRSMAAFCESLGFNLFMVVPKEFRKKKERVQEIQALGAKLVWTDREKGVNEVANKTRELMHEYRKQGYTRIRHMLHGQPIYIFKKGDDVVWFPNHAENLITPESFRFITKEVIQQLPENAKEKGFIYVATLGNGSTLKGISEELREAFGEIEVIGVETRNAPVNAIRKLQYELGIPEKDEENPLLKAAFLARYGYPIPSYEQQTYHDVPGMSTPGYKPKFIEVDKLDDVVLVEGKIANRTEWVQFMEEYNFTKFRHFQDEDTIGYSSAIELLVAIELAKKAENAGKNFLVLAHDQADQYPGWPPAFNMRVSTWEDMVEFSTRRARMMGMAA